MRTSLTPTQRVGLRLTATAGLAALIAAAGCSDDPATPSTRANPLAGIRPCELLTAEEIENAIGTPVAAGEDVSQAGVPMCNWARAGSEFRVGAGILVTRSYYDSFEAFRQSQEGDLAFEPGSYEQVAVDGAAFGVWLPEIGMLQAYGDALMVQVSVDAAGVDALDSARALARLALERVR